MPSDLKRKSPPRDTDIEPSSPKRRAQSQEATSTPNSSTSATKQAVPEDVSASRAARFKALQARQHASRTQNRAETAAEAQRQSVDPNLLNALNRKHAIASHKLMKTDASASGEDFERKRAWDWTAEEAERWDRRMQKKERHRDDVAFQDYRQDARKVYKRQTKELKADMEGYEREKGEAMRRAAESGGLEVVETEDGELVAVDREGTFYSTADSTGFVEQKPEREKVDRLVEDLKKAEEVRLRKRRERRGKDDDGDITFVNEKNKQFNQKLQRFYDKYTAEIRDNFERGTAV